MTARLPTSITGHFAPQRGRFILAPYHQGQIAVRRLVAQLRAFRIIVAKRQVIHLLNEGQKP